MRWAALVGLGLSAAPAALALPGCQGDEGGALVYDGTAGQPIPASFEQWVASASAEVDGRSETLLFDSGSPLTLLDTDSAPDLSPGFHPVALDLGGLHMPEVDAAAFDVFSYQQDRTPPLDGIVGGDILSHFALSLDYQGQRVWLEDTSPAPLPDGVAASAVGAAVEVPARVAGGGAFAVPGCSASGSACLRSIGATRFLVRAEVEDQTDADAFWVVVDTGASSVVLSRQVMDSLESGSRPRLDGVTVGTASGVQTAYLSRVWSLRLGAAAGSGAEADLDSVPVLVLPTDDLFDSVSAEVGEDVRGLVGGSFLRWFLTTLDYPGQDLRLRPFNDTSYIDPEEYVGVGFELAASPSGWVIDAVYPGTDAAAQGLEVGQVVDRLADTDIAGLSASEVSALFEPFHLGDHVPVVVDGPDGAVSRSVAVEDLLPPYEAP